MTRLLQTLCLTALTVLALLLAATPSQAAGGRLAGVVRDSATDQPLSGATVYLPMQGRGAIAEEDGQFTIDSLGAGYYTIEVSVVGYTKRRDDNVRVRNDSTTTVDIDLTSTVLPLGEEIVVFGKRAVINVANPSTRRRIDRGDLLGGAQSAMELIMQQPGITQVDREVHVRGARTYETEYLLDGVAVTDPFLRRGMGVRIPDGAVERIDVVTGGLRADLSGASGGVIALESLEPTSKLSGQVEYRTDALSPTSAGNWNTAHATVHLTGPLSAFGLPWLSDDSRFTPGFLVALSGDLSDTYLGTGQPNSSVWGGTRWAPRSDNRYHSLLKLSWRLNPAHKVNLLFTGDNSIDQDQSALDTRLRTATYSYGWPFAYSKNLQNANTFTHQSNAQIARWEWRPTNTTGWRLAFSRVFIRLHSDVNGKEPSDYVPPQDTGPVIIEPSPDSSYFTVRAGDGFYDIGDGDLWHDHFTESYTARADLQIAPRVNWDLNVGGEVSPKTVQVIDIFRPWLGLGGLNTDHYQVHPFNGASWAQIHANIYGTIIDLGLRGELWWPGQYLEDVIADTTLPNITAGMRHAFDSTTISLFGRRAHVWLVPRIGIAHAVGPSMSVFASYDRLERRPNPRFVYAKLTSRSPATYQLLGNPALVPEKTIAIEGGIKWLWSPDWGITASIYQRDVHDYIAALAFVPDEDRPEDFWYAYANRGLAQSRGIEITLNGRHHSTFSTTAMLALARVRGEQSLPDDIFRGRFSREGHLLLAEVALDWDKPWRASASANWTFGPDDRPRILGVPLGGHWDFGAALHIEAGKRYTPYRDSLNDEGESVYVRDGGANSRLGPDWQSLDLTLAKHIPLGAGRLSFQIVATNILNHSNVTLINPVTGDVYREQDPVPTGDNFFETPPAGYDLPIWNDSARFDRPSHWQFSVRWSW